jgi:hypothetical protein
MRDEQIIEILVESEQNERHSCMACDCYDERVYWTKGGKGPFCGECIDALCDPDQALLLEERLAKFESDSNRTI